MRFLLELEEKYGYRVGWAPISVLEDIAEELASRREELSAFQRSYFGGWPDLQAACSLGMKSVIIVSFPVGELNCFRLQFDYGEVEAVIPAGYRNAKGKYGVVFRRLQDLLRSNGIHCTEIQSNLKNLAVRTGIAEYGRNDITYVEGFGSYHALVGVACDAELFPVYFPERQVPHRMSRCADCGLCVKACAFGAIPKDSGMIDMERCVTLYNEEAADWPDWLDPKKSRCLIGCAACQLCCPANQGILRRGEPYLLTWEELSPLVGDAPPGKAACEKIQEKIDAIGLNGFEESVFHNIKLLYRANCPE